MTISEKIEAMKVGIAPDEASDEVLEFELRSAEQMILNKMYPFGYEDGKEVPVRYQHLQVKLAIELFSQRGAEGQSSHSENGISRTWPSVSRILAQVMPHVGSVIKNA
jgi:hypothetical protein